MKFSMDSAVEAENAKAFDRVREWDCHHILPS